MFINCSGDDEITGPGSVYTNPQDNYMPTEPQADNSALEMPGFPKIIKKYQDGNLYYWAQYFYSPDGNLLKVNYSHPNSGSERFTDTYRYNTDGKLIGLDGHDVYSFYWDKEQIVKADKYNSVWYGRIKIFYNYNLEGQLIQKIENYIDFSFSDKTTYSYLEDGNLNTIEYYSQDEDSGVFQLYSVTNFDGYSNHSNMFLELEIIPGQIVQHYFPASMNVIHINESGNETYEIYDYKYDSDGRVIEKISGSNIVVYQYY